MKRNLIAIAGTTGAGKSTLARRLAIDPSVNATVIHLDDFYRKRELLRRQGEFINWDHPDAIDFDSVARTLRVLKEGRPATIFTWDPILNPDYVNTKQKIAVEIVPSHLIIIDGFLALFSESVRELYDLSFFLDVPIEIGIQRRSGKIMQNKEYLDTIVRPMQEMHVLPTKQYASQVLDSFHLGPNEIFEKALAAIRSIN